MVTENAVYRMNELVKLTGVSKQTIHYYLREGLLLPPVRVSRNMAYYDGSTVDDIRYIKELQEKKYLPLAVIKEILKSRREGTDMDAEDHMAAMEQLFLQARDGSAGETMDEKTFLKETGLTGAEQKQMIETGVIVPSGKGKERRFDGFDAGIARALKRLLGLGMSVEDLKIYGDYLKWSRAEAVLMHDRIIHGGGDGQHPPLKEIQADLERARLLLTAKAYREMLVNHKHTTDHRRGDERDD